MKASCTANASRLAQCAYQIGPHILPVFYLERSVSFFPAIHDDDDERVVGLGTTLHSGADSRSPEECGAARSKTLLWLL